MNITVKNVPDSVYRVIKGEAKRKEAKSQFRNHSDARSRSDRGGTAFLREHFFPVKCINVVNLPAKALKLRGVISRNTF